MAPVMKWKLDAPTLTSADFYGDSIWMKALKFARAIKGPVVKWTEQAPTGEP